MLLNIFYTTIATYFVFKFQALALQPDITEPPYRSPPKIIKQPPTDEILYQVAQQWNENDRIEIVLECEAEGVPTPTYRWVKNGKKIDLQSYDDRMSQQPGRGTIIIERPKDVDEGQYQCFSENEHGIATSNSVFVRKAELNKFKDEQPKVVSAIEGDPFTLQCQPPDGWPKPNIYWLIQNTDGGIKSINNSRITLDPEGNLHFSNVTRYDASDDFVYVCAATSKFQNEYKIGILLDVVQIGISPTQNRFQPTLQYVTRNNKTALRGKKVELYCIYGGTPLPQTIWSKDGKLIYWNDQITQGNYGKSLIIRNTTFKDQGSYTCETSNGVGNAQNYSINLSVNAVPYFTVEPEIQNVAEDESVEFRCEAFGAPAPEVKWIRNGLELTGGRYQTQSNGDLVIQDVSFADAGEYTCHAHNILGDAEASGSLIVKEHTRITDEPQDYEIAAGNPAIFRCNAVTDPSLDLNIKWLSDSEEIDFENEPRFVRTNDNSLTISKTAELDSGIYTCVASTELDEARASATLIVQDVPNAPKLTDISCRAREAYISWDPQGDNRAPILYYTIQYNTSFTPDIWTVVNDNIPYNNLAYNVPMSPWANYTFRVIAFNKIGPSLPSAQISDACTTQPDVPYKNPEDVKGEATTTTNLVISWTHMPQIEHNGPGFHYRVSWKRDIRAENWNIDDIYDWKQDKYVILDQQTFVRYRIKVSAVNKFGVSNTTAIEKIVYSGEDRPTQAPNNFTLVQVTASTSAIFSWNEVPTENDTFIEHKTSSIVSHPPDRPDFTWKQLSSENGEATIQITWIPNVNGTLGTNFYVKYRVKEAKSWMNTQNVIEEDFVIIQGLSLDKTYEICVVSVDGEYSTESQIQDIRTIGSEFEKVNTNTTTGVCLKKMKNLTQNLYIKHRLKGEQTFKTENDFFCLRANKVHEVVVTSADDDDFDTDIDMTLNGIGALIQKALRIQEYWKNILKEFIVNGDVKAVEVLIKNPAEDLRHIREPWPLHEAAYRGYTDVVKLLLKNGVNVNSKNKNGNTALHRATSNDKIDIVKILLEHGADVNAENLEGDTPLRMANNIDIKVLLRKNAKGQTSYDVA